MCLTFLRFQGSLELCASLSYSSPTHTQTRNKRFQAVTYSKFGCDIRVVCPRASPPVSGERATPFWVGRRALSGWVWGERESQLTDWGSDCACNVDVTVMKPLYKEPTPPISHFLIFQQKLPASFSSCRTFLTAVTDCRLGRIGRIVYEFIFEAVAASSLSGAMRHESADRESATPLSLVQGL